MSAGYTTQRSVQVSGFANIGLLTPLRRLYPISVRRTSALPAASFRFAVAHDTLAVRLAFPLAGYAEDFHLQVNAPCRAQQRKSPGKRGFFDVRIVLVVTDPYCPFPSVPR
jgi:hypothetical protein